MTLEEAKKILDMVKDGQPLPVAVIDEALWMTGDGACMRDMPCNLIEDFLDALREEGRI